MNNYAAYIDESGNHDLATEKEGASRYFLVLAVLIPQAQVSELEVAIEVIRAKHFGAGEMKSSNVKDERRIKILEDLALIDFQFYAVAVDKERVDKDSGLKHKKTFIKFANGRIYSALFKNIANVSIFADAHGSPEFTLSFKEYIRENHRPDLFSTGNLEMVDSKTNVLIQLADFLVGTIAKLYEKKSTEQFRKDFLKFITNKRIRVDEWPPRYEWHGGEISGTNKLDEKVRSISLNSAARFLNRSSQEDDIERRIQEATLQFLLFQATFPTNEEVHIPTQKIVEHLHLHGFTEVTKHYLRSSVISKLRDHDVIVASSPRGYKIPTSYTDIVEFANLVDGIASPLLARLDRASDIFDLASVGQIRILDDPRFKRLRLMLSKLKEAGDGNQLGD